MMSDAELVSESDIKQVSVAWVAARVADNPVDDWVEDWQDRRRLRGDYVTMWRLVLRLCEDVRDYDSETVKMIGVDTLWSMIYRWPDETLTLIEAEAPKNSTLLVALSAVITSEPSIRDRIDAILGHQ